MAKEIKAKQSFGTVAVQSISPALSDKVKSVNIQVSFEDALKLQLGLNQLLFKLNSYNRNSAAARDQMVNLCLFNDSQSITITEQKLVKPKVVAEPKEGDDLDQLLKDYIAEVEASTLERTTKTTYIVHASSFVRWTRGKFKPGSSKGKQS